MKFCFIFNLLFFLAFSSNSYSSETFELEGLSSHIKKPLTTFLEDPEIRGFLTETAGINLSSGDIKIFGSTVLSLTNHEIIPSDLDLVALCDAFRLEAIMSQSSIDNFSSWNVSSFSRTFNSPYGDYAGLLCVFTHRIIPNLSIDLFCMNKNDYFKKDPAFSINSKNLSYQEAINLQTGEILKQSIRIDYLREKDFGTRETIEDCIREKVLHIPMVHGNEAILFRLIYSMIKHGFKPLSPLTVEKCFFHLIQAEKNIFSYTTLIAKKAIASGNPQQFYKILYDFTKESFLLKRYKNLTKDRSIDSFILFLKQKASKSSSSHSFYFPYKLKSRSLCQLKNNDERILRLLSRSLDTKASTHDGEFSSYNLKEFMERRDLKPLVNKRNFYLDLSGVLLEECRYFPDKTKIEVLSFGSNPSRGDYLKLRAGIKGSSNLYLNTTRNEGFLWLGFTKKTLAPNNLEILMEQDAKEIFFSQVSNIICSYTPLEERTYEAENRELLTQTTADRARQQVALDASTCSGGGGGALKDNPQAKTLEIALASSEDFASISSSLSETIASASSTSSKTSLSKPQGHSTKKKKKKRRRKKKKKTKKQDPDPDDAVLEEFNATNAAVEKTAEETRLQFLLRKKIESKREQDIITEISEYIQTLNELSQDEVLGLDAEKITNLDQKLKFMTQVLKARERQVTRALLLQGRRLESSALEVYKLLQDARLIFLFTCLKAPINPSFDPNPIITNLMKKLGVNLFNSEISKTLEKNNLRNQNEIKFLVLYTLILSNLKNFPKKSDTPLNTYRIDFSMSLMKVFLESFSSGYFGFQGCNRDDLLANFICHIPQNRQRDFIYKISGFLREDRKSCYTLLSYFLQLFKKSLCKEDLYTECSTEILVLLLERSSVYLFSPMEFEGFKSICQNLLPRITHDSRYSDISNKYEQMTEHYLKIREEQDMLSRSLANSCNRLLKSSPVYLGRPVQ